MPPRRTRLARRTGLAPMSDKRAETLPTRREVVARVLARDGHRCRAYGLAPGRCGGHLDVHEVIPRSAWRGGELVESNCLTVCRTHHEWIGVHPGRAHDLGLHGYSYERPAAS